MPARLTAAVLLFCPALVSAADPPDAAKAAVRVKEVIGHMGSCADRPGNTVIGVRRAIEAGAARDGCDGGSHHYRPTALSIVRPAFSTGPG